MNWQTLTLEQLDAIYENLGLYIQARQRQAQQGRLEQIRAERTGLELELKEIQAQLAAHEEMVARLKKTLKLAAMSENGKSEPIFPNDDSNVPFAGFNFDDGDL